MKFAIVHNWPGQQNSEFELIQRIIKIAEEAGHQCTIIDPLGHILSKKGRHLKELRFINSFDINLVLNLHYTSPNFLNSFSYIVNWNPIDYIIRNPIDSKILKLDQIAYRTYCLSSHDVILSSGSKEVNRFAQAVNCVRPMQLNNHDLSLHTSCDVIDGFEFPDFKRFKVFYIGANWEKQKRVKQRHLKMLKSLDNSGYFEFYGVSQINGIKLWEGIKNYKGELPFDGGISISRKSNECGVSLILHSKAHNDSGLVSTRIFQACASKTLSICENNDFISEHFRDSVLSFENTENEEENAKKIINIVEWIKKNPYEAKEKAKKAHKIFKNKFTLKSEINSILNNHNKIISKYNLEFCNNDVTVNIDILFFYEEHRNELLKKYFTDLSTQVSIKLRAVVFTLIKYDDKIRKIAADYNIKLKIIIIPKGKGYKNTKRGYFVAHYLEKIKYNAFFCVYSSQGRWKKMHLTQLAKALKEKDSIAISGTFVKNDYFNDLKSDYYRIAMKSIDVHPKGICENDLAHFNSHRFSPASILFRSDDFNNKDLLKMLRFFDSGWYLFLVLWNYLNTQKLPTNLPKLSVMHTNNGREWGIGIYKGKKQSRGYEESIAYAFMKNNPIYLSLIKRYEKFSVKKEIKKKLLEFTIIKRIFNYINKY